MKRSIRVLVALLVLASTMCNFMGVALAEGAAAVQTPDSLLEVYVSDSGTPDASGADRDHPISDFGAALSVVKKNGVITVLDTITVSDLVFPDKTVFVFGSSGETRSRMLIGGNVIGKNFVTMQDLDLVFTGEEKDRIFVNGARLELKDCGVVGYPNVYLGAQDRDLEYEEKGAFILRNEKSLPTEIQNIDMAGYNGHVTHSTSVELKNVTISGKIDGSNLAERGYFTAAGETVVAMLTNVPKADIEDFATLRITQAMERVTELYGDRSYVTLDSQAAPLDITYVYGNLTLGFSGERTENRLLTCKKATGSVALAEANLQSGYTLNEVKSGNDLVFDLVPPGGAAATNYAPSITCSPERVLREGIGGDIREGVTAEDYEDGDLTDAIVFPDVDLAKLPEGTHEIWFQVTDSDGNTTKTSQKVYIIHNSYPIFDGVEDLEIPVKDVENFDLLQGITVRDDKDTELQIQVEGQLERPEPGTEADFTITYQATDSNGHITKATRVITVTNFLPEPGELPPVEIQQDQTFDWMEGVTAKDYEDGDVTNITIEQPIDTSVPGTYELVYIVTDSDGNTVRATRQVTITAKPAPEPDPEPEVKPDPEPEVKPDPKPDVKPDPKPEVKPDPKPEVKPDPKPDVKPDPKPEAKPDPKPEVKPDPKPEAKPDPKPEAKPDPKPDAKPNSETNQNPGSQTEIKPGKVNQDDKKPQEPVPADKTPEKEEQTASETEEATTAPTETQKDPTEEKPNPLDVEPEKKPAAHKKSPVLIIVLVVIAVISLGIAYKMRKEK